MFIEIVLRMSPQAVVSEGIETEAVEIGKGVTN